MKRKFFVFLFIICLIIPSGVIFTACTHTHSMTHYEPKQSTCVDDGNVEYWYCTSCDKMFSDEEGKTEIKDVVIKALGHNFGEWTDIDNIDCIHGGTQQRTCSNCNAFEEREIDPLGHEWGEWIIIEEATCTEDGIETRTCSRCQATETRDILTSGHDYEWSIIKEATCTEDGMETGICSRCQDTITRQITALGGEHDYELIQEEGKVFNVCSKCGDRVEVEAGDIEEYPYVLDSTNIQSFYFLLADEKDLYVKLDENVNLASNMFNSYFNGFGMQNSLGKLNMDLSNHTIYFTGTTQIEVSGRDLYIENGTIKIPNGFVFGDNTNINFVNLTEVSASGNTLVTIDGNAVVSINNTYLLSDGGYGLHLSSSAIGSKIDIIGSSSVVSAKDDYCAILFEGDSTLNVSAGVQIIGRGQALVMKAGTANLTEARLTAKLTTSTFVNYSNDATTWGEGNQVGYGALVVTGTSDVTIKNGGYYNTSMELPTALQNRLCYAIGIYAYGENAEIVFDVNDIVVNNYIINYNNTANLISCPQDSYVLISELPDYVAHEIYNDFIFNNGVLTAYMGFDKDIIIPSSYSLYDTNSNEKIITLNSKEEVEKFIFDDQSYRYFIYTAGQYYVTPTINGVEGEEKFVSASELLNDQTTGKIGYFESLINQATDSLKVEIKFTSYELNIEDFGESEATVMAMARPVLELLSGSLSSFTLSTNDGQTVSTTFENFGLETMTQIENIFSQAMSNLEMYPIG